MKVEKVTVSIEDGTMDCIGGVRTEYTPYDYTDVTTFKIKAATDDANIVLTLTGYELDSIKHIIWRRI